jgi:adenylate kinase
MKKMKAILLLGPPGSGKGTQALSISRALNAKILGIGQLLREEIKNHTPLGQEVEPFVSRGLFPEVQVVMQVLKRALSFLNGEYVILDGVPRTLDQVDWVEKILAEFQIKIQHVFLFDVPAEVLKKRLSLRCYCLNCQSFFSQPSTSTEKSPITCTTCHGSMIERRSDDSADVVNQRLHLYEETGKLILDFYRERELLTVIDGKKPSEQITKDILALIHETADGEH